MNRVETLRALLIATIESIFPVLILVNVVNFTTDEIAIIMLFVTNTVTLAFLAIKP